MTAPKVDQLPLHGPSEPDPWGRKRYHSHPRALGAYFSHTHNRAVPGHEHEMTTRELREWLSDAEYPGTQASYNTPESMRRAIRAELARRKEAKA